MKRFEKIIVLLIILVLVFTACTSKEAVKTEEELKAEIKAEMEAEAKLKEELKEEVKAEMKAEQNYNNKDSQEESQSKAEQEESKINQNFENGIGITGDLSYNYAPYFLKLTTYEPITVKGKEYTDFMLESDIICKFLDRDQFAYNPEGFAVLDNSNNIVNIEFDANTAYDSDLGYMCIKDYRILEINYKKPVDKSNESYPIKYYQDVINSLCYFMYGANERDVKKNAGYKENADFKEAVDIAIKRGYKVIKEDGYYRIASDSVIDISSTPTVNEMCEIIGISMSDLTTQEDGGYFLYNTNYSNDDISFRIYHDDKSFSGNEKVNNITVISPRYSLYKIKFGDKLINAYDSLDSKYENIINHHSISGEEKVKYIYSVDNRCLKLNNYGFGYEDVEINDTELVKEIHSFELLD